MARDEGGWLWTMRVLIPFCVQGITRHFHPSLTFDKHHLDHLLMIDTIIP